MAIQPFKKKYINFNEVMFTINLHFLFVLSLYDQTTMIAANIMVAIAAVHFAVIIMYHITTYTCGAVIKQTMEMMMIIIKKRLTMLFKRNENDEDRLLHLYELQELIMGLDQ